MLFMVVEHFRAETRQAMAERFATRGRLLPDGVEYIDSWMAADGGKCYQLMRAADADALEVWIDRWSDLVDFEFEPVIASAQYWAT